MSYSRRNFLKAAGSGVVLTAVAGETLVAAPTAPPSVAKPFASEKALFIVNGKTYAAEYEARTTLWEVISMKLGMTGTNRSCNRASCGACSVLVDGTPLYSCHTLATEAVGHKILTIEGVGDEKNLHPLQRVGHTRVAADCGFCTAGWVVTAKGLLDKNPNPNEDQVKAALAGHICRCSAYPNIIRTVMDSAAVLRGSNIKIEPELDSVVHIKMPMVRDYSSSGGHLAGDEVVEGKSKTVTKKWQGYPPENLNVLGKPLPPLPEVSIPRFTGKAQYASRVWFRDLLYTRFLTSPHPHARVLDVDTSAAEKMPGVRHILTFKNAPKLERPNVARGRILPDPLPRELNLQGEVVAIVVAETEDLAQDAADAIKVEYEVLPFASRLEDSMAPDAPDLGHGKGNLIRHAISPKDFPHATWADQRGDVEKGFAEADMVKEFTYHFTGGVSVPMQPSGSVAKWDGDRLTMWGMGQGIYPVRATLAAALGMDPLEGTPDQQVQRFHIRRRAHGRGEILSADRASGESHGPSRESDAAQGPGTGATGDQAGDHHQVPRRRQERWAHCGPRPRSVREHRRPGFRRARRRSKQRHQPVGVVHVAGSSLAIDVVRLSDQLAASRTFAQPSSTGNQVVLGKHDR